MSRPVTVAMLSTVANISAAMLSGSRAEAEPWPRRDESPRAYIAVKRALVTNVLANLDARFPQVDLMDAMKVRAYLMKLIVSDFH